jgi:anti-sigma B factor antagonist
VTISSHPDPQPRVTLDGDRAVFRLSDAQFKDLGDDSVGQPLSRLVDDVGRVNVAFDFEAVKFLNSVGLGTLLTLHKKLKAAGGRLTLFNVRPAVYEIFAVTKLTTVLEVRQAGAREPP